jgi:hypothetical protein
MASAVFILISLVLLYSGVHLLVRVFTQVKDPLFQEFFVIIAIGFILIAACAFYVGIHGWL